MFFLFAILLVLALVGDARVFFFVANRIVFGSHLEEKPRFQWLLKLVPPLLLALTLLFWPLGRWLSELTPRPALVAHIGAAWLFIAAGIGTYWILDRALQLVRRDQPVAGTRTLPSEVFALRKRHVKFPHNDVYDLEVTKHEVLVRDLPHSFDGYRIAFLTDTHVAAFVRRDYYRAIVAQTLRFDPDLILCGGDFVHWERHIPLMADVLFTDLRARDGIYAVLGNHDYWANPDGVIAALTARGVRFVINRSIDLQRGDDTIALVGIDEVYRGKPDLDSAFARVPPHVPRIGLTHHPDIIGSLTDRRLDLLLIGHTHGGQIRFPFFGSVVVPSKHEARYASGFHRVGDVLLYVSRGLGAIPPVRILCKPELATFVLRRDEP